MQKRSPFEIRVKFSRRRTSIYLPRPPFVFETVETNEPLSTLHEIALGTIARVRMMPVTDIALFREAVRATQAHRRAEEHADSARYAFFVCCLSKFATATAGSNVPRGGTNVESRDTECLLS